LHSSAFDSALPERGMRGGVDHSPQDRCQPPFVCSRAQYARPSSMRFSPRIAAEALRAVEPVPAILR
jgi:hypothetical protein